MRTRLGWCALFMIACSGAPPPEPTAGPKADPTAAASPPPEGSAPAASAPNAAPPAPAPSSSAAATAPPEPSAGGMKRAAAEKYVLGLINRDRKAAGLPPVV